MGRKKQDKADLPRRSNGKTVHLPEARPESNAYRVVSKTRYAGQALSQKKSDDKDKVAVSKVNSSAAEVRSPVGNRPSTNLNENSAKAEKKSSAKRSPSAEKNAARENSSVAVNSEITDTADKMKTAAKAAAFNNYQSSTHTPISQGTNDQLRAKAEALQQRMSANVELAEREHFSDSNSSKTASYRVQTAKSEYMKLRQEEKRTDNTPSKEGRAVQKIDRQLTKTEKLMRADKAGLLESVIDKGQKVAAVYTEAAAAANKDTVGESAMAMAAIPVHFIGREVLFKAQRSMRNSLHKRYVIKQRKKIDSLEKQKREAIKRLKESNLTPEEINKEGKNIKRLNKKQDSLKKNLNKTGADEKAFDNSIAVLQAAAKVSSEIESADSTGEAAVKAVTALPKHIVKEKAIRTVSDVSHNLYRKQLEAKREKLKAQRDKVEKRAAIIRKEHVAREMKVNIYKSAHGITSQTATTAQNAGAAIKATVETITKAATTIKSSAAAIAVAGSILPVIIVIIIIIILVISLFSWIQPHTEEQYNEATNSWREVYVDGDDKALLQGYIKHISDYFDKKQLEILEVVDINFGGFEPDKYNYQREEDRNGVLNFEDMKNLTVEETVYYYTGSVTYEYITGRSPGSKGNPGGTPIWGATSQFIKSYDVFCKQYYKIDEDQGYEVRCTSAEAESEAVYMNITIDMQGYYDTIYQQEMAEWKNNQWRAKPVKYTFDNGTLYSGMNLSEVTVTQYKDGAVYKSMPAFDFAKEFILEHPYVLNYTISSSGNSYQSLTLPTDVKNIQYSLTLASASEEKIMEDKQYIFKNYVWNLNEYQNRWIKLTDDCDYEHIIAMAAIKKFQDITATGFDDQNYTFTINDDDLDYCLDELYEFSYSYSIGPCRNKNCYRYMTNKGWAYKCGNYSHKHLIGNVVNYEVVGGIDMILNRVLNKNTEISLEDKKSIYDVYVEYVYGILGTSTKIPDYENDRESQERLLHMHEAKHGKKPTNPVRNLRCNGVTIAEHPGGHVYLGSFIEIVRSWESYVLDISWDAPEPEEYSEGKFTEISGYKVYLYNRSSGSVQAIANTSGTSCTVDLEDWTGYGWGLKRIQTGNIVLDSWNIERGEEKEVVEQGQVYIVVVPYNSNGDGKREQLYIQLKP